MAQESRTSCRDDCDYQLLCGKQYRKKGAGKGKCRKIIDSVIKNQIYGEPQKKSFTANSIEFKTINPTGTVRIIEGRVNILR